MAHGINRSNEFFLNEAAPYRGRAPAPIAGKETENYRDLPTHERLARGIASEGIIVDHLRELGTVKVSGFQQDTRDKIDAFITFGGKDPSDPQFEVAEELAKKFPGEHSMQIKMRVTGADIGMEVLKDFDQNITGRDMIGGSELYVVRSGDGIGIFHAETLKAKVKALFATANRKELSAEKDKLKHNLWYYRANKTLTGLALSADVGQLRVTKGRNDGKEGARKLLAYIAFNSLTPVHILHV